MQPFSIPGLTLARLTPWDAGTLASFFAILARDDETVRFFHPHLLTTAAARELCERAGRRRDRYYLMRHRNVPIAYSMLRGWDEGYSIPSFGGCTHPGLRNAGLGQFLLMQAIRESQAAGAPRLRLTVYKSNERAVHVYRKLGFTFTDKNEQELVGVLDLAVPLAQVRPPDGARLDAWIAGGCRTEAA